MRCVFGFHDWGLDLYLPTKEGQQQVMVEVACRRCLKYQTRFILTFREPVQLEPGALRLGPNTRFYQWNAGAADLMASEQGTHFFRGTA